MNDRQERSALLGCVGVLHGSMDALTTTWGISLFGPQIESNGVVTSLVNEVGLAGIPVLMLAGMAVFGALMHGIDSWSRRAGTATLYAAVSIGLIVILSNLVVLTNAAIL